MKKNIAHRFSLIGLILSSCLLLSAQNITVNTIDDSDDGICDATHCSLREAIIATNNNLGADNIHFNIIGAGPHIIVLDSLLPGVSDSETIIDGTSQPGNFPMNGLIVIDGSIAGKITGSTTSGITFFPNTANNELYGIQIQNFNSYGLYTYSENAIIGAPEKGNVIISCNGGMIIQGRNSLVQANYVGTDLGFNQNLGNTNHGILLASANNGGSIGTIIGGDFSLGEGNIVVNNNANGISGSGAENGIIQGNYVGTIPGADTDFGNKNAGIGIGAPNMIIGGTDNRGNVVAYNSMGVQIFEGGNAVTNGILITQNSIFCNRRGIFFQGTVNDNQLAPIINCALKDSIFGTAKPNELIEVYFEESIECPNSAACQGKRYVGNTIADNVGNWLFLGNFPIASMVTATATNQNQSTSQFSDCQQVSEELVVMASNEGPFCQGQVLQLSGTINSQNDAIVFNWTGPNGYTYNIQNTMDAIETGIYKFTAELNCMTTSATTEVRFKQTIEVTIGNTPNEMLCPGESRTINGTLYNQNNPSGVEQLTGLNGDCDTLLTVELQFFEPIISVLSPTLCLGESITINGELYNENNLTGRQIMEGSAASGCDSTIEIQLSFYPVAEANIARTICKGDVFELNGTIYNEGNPSGTEVLVGSTTNNCDSIVHIQLQFTEQLTTVLRPEVCRGNTYEFMGKTYDENNPTGTELLNIKATNGCDSIVEIALQFLDPQIEQFNNTYCSGESININGTVYDKNNPSGMELLSIKATNGCDSLLEINLTFLEAVSEVLELQLCPNEFRMINGTRYDANNLSGTELFSKATANGCDSLINVAVKLIEPATSFFQETLCANDFRVINETIYNQSNPFGLEIFPSAASNGCDSIMDITLNFKPLNFVNIDTVLCMDESIQINGTVYNQQNPVGIEFIEQSDRCDSLVIQLIFQPEIVGSITGKTSLRLGDSLALTFNLSGANQFDVQFSADGESLILLTNISDGHTIFVSPQHSVTYTILDITASGSKGCAVSIASGLRVLVEIKNSVYFPSVFSPNRDGINDVFIPLSNDEVNQINYLRIYDRWGNQIFERKNFQANDGPSGWDGTYKGQKLGNGVFIYFSEVLFTSGKKEIFKGEIVVLANE